MLASVPIVTTQMVLVEALNHLSGEGKQLRDLATGLVRELQSRPEVTIIPQD